MVGRCNTYSAQLLSVKVTGCALSHFTGTEPIFFHMQISQPEFLSHGTARTLASFLMALGIPRIADTLLLSLPRACGWNLPDFPCSSHLHLSAVHQDFKTSGPLHAKMSLQILPLFPKTNASKDRMSFAPKLLVF